MLAVNRTRGTLIGVDIARADTIGARMRGLYAYRRLELGDGIWLVPCNGVQTIGMKHTIDVIFLDRRGRIVRICEHLRPGKFIWWIRKAHSALELSAGAVRSSEAQLGDLIDFVDLANLPLPSTESRGDGEPVHPPSTAYNLSLEEDGP
jgi:uncharacterized membrane protein (UPF0127 family)